MIDVSDREYVYLTGNGKLNEKLNVEDVDEVVATISGAKVHLEPVEETTEPAEGEAFEL